MMRLSRMAVVVLGIAVSGMYSPVANANPSVTVAVSGQSYTITTVVGSESTLSATLAAQPWFGNVLLQIGVAGAVGSQLGLPNLGIDSFPAGPAFSDSVSATYGTVNYLQYVPQLSSDVLGASADAALLTFAEVMPATNPTTVPEPTSIVMLCAGLGALRLTRRQQSPTKTAGSLL